MALKLGMGMAIGKDHEQGRFAVAQGVKLQFVRFHQIPELFDIEWG